MKKPALAGTRGGAGRGRGPVELPSPLSSENDEDGGWLLIYLDVMTLLLVLCFVLLTFADLDPEPPVPAFSGPAAPQPPPTLPGVLPPPWALPADPPDGDAAQAPGEPETDTAEADPTETDPVADEVRAPEGVERVRVDDGVLLRIEGSLLFPSGSAALTAEGEALLQDLAEALRDHPGAISVEGHTDDRPIATDAFPSNWELSAARATRVLRRLVDAGVPAEQLRAVGRADTAPVAPNTNEPGRRANRRVDVLLHDTD